MMFALCLQYGSQRVPTAASPSNTNSSSSSNTGSQSGTLSTSLSNNMGPGPAGEQLSKTNLYIRGLNQNTTDKDLVQMCSMWVTDLGCIIASFSILKCKQQNLSTLKLGLNGNLPLPENFSAPVYIEW